MSDTFVEELMNLSKMGAWQRNKNGEFIKTTDKTTVSVVFEIEELRTLYNAMREYIGWLSREVDEYPEPESDKTALRLHCKEEQKKVYDLVAHIFSKGFADRMCYEAQLADDVEI